MNKRPNTRRNELEDELIGDISDQQAQHADTGKYRNYQDPYSMDQEARNRGLNMSLGHRRRHPLRVLHQHQAVVSTTEDAKSVWEQALTQDDERTKLPEIYKIDNMRLMSTQVGLEEVSEKAWKQKTSRMNKLSTVIGV